MLTRLFARENVDIFCYGEAQVIKSNSMLIEGFDYYLHSAYLNKSDNYRRGLAIFFREQFRFLFSKVYVCKKLEIVWMRLIVNLACT